MTKKIKDLIKNIREKASIHNLLITGILILSFIVSTFIFRNVVRRNILDALVKASNDISERSETFSDYALEINKNMCFFIYNDSNVTELRNMEEFDLSKSSILLRNINNLITSSNYVDSVYIYNEKFNYIFSTSREGNTLDKFFDKEAVSLFLNRENINNLSPILRDFRVSTSSNTNQIYSFIIYDDNNAVMVNVSPLIYNGLFSIENTSSPSYIIDEDLNVITSSNKNKKLNISEDKLNELKNNINNNIDSGYIIDNRISFNSPVLIYSKITNNNWYYLLTDTYGSLFPSSLSFERVSNAILTIFSIILLLMLVLFVLPYYRIHRSISKAEIDIDTNILHDKLNRLIELSLDSNRMNKSISSMMREEMIKSYVYGANQDNNIEDITNEYGIRLDSNDKLKLILVSNGTRNKDYKDIARKYSEKVEGVLLGGNHVLLLVQDNNEDTYIRIVDEIHDKYSKQRNIVLSDYIYFKDIHETYDYMMKLTLLFVLRSGLNFIDLKEIKEINNLSKDELHSKARNIIALLKDGKLNEASNAYEEYMSYINEDTDNDLRIIRYLRTHLDECLTKLDNSIHFSNEDIDKWIRDFKTRENIDNYFFELFQKISIQYADEKRSKALKISNDVINILKNNYKDPTISAQSIADDLNLSYAYCSRVFKQVNNQSISNYLNDYRLEEASKLLKQKDIQIKDISSLVGFENHQYFFVLFKKKYGETPRSYHLKYTS